MEIACLFYVCKLLFMEIKLLSLVVYGLWKLPKLLSLEIACVFLRVEIVVCGNYFGFLLWNF